MLFGFQVCAVAILECAHKIGASGWREAIQNWLQQSFDFCFSVIKFGSGDALSRVSSAASNLSSSGFT
jgi:hypothetical protein